MAMITKFHKYYPSKAAFLSEKISAAPDDTIYWDDNEEQLATIVGTPDVKWKDICFINDNGGSLIWTHGQYWNDMSDLQDTCNELSTGKVSKNGDTMTGALVAQSNTNYTTAQVRNTIISTNDPTSADGNNGDIWIVYNA